MVTREDAEFLAEWVRNAGATGVVPTEPGRALAIAERVLETETPARCTRSAACTRPVVGRCHVCKEPHCAYHASAGLPHTCFACGQRGEVGIGYRRAAI